MTARSIRFCNITPDPTTSCLQKTSSKATSYRQPCESFEVQCHRLGKSTHNARNERPHPLRRCPSKIAHLIPSWSKTTTDTPVRPRAILSSPKPEAISLAEITLDINDTNRSRLNASHHLRFTSNRNARTNRHSNSSSQAPPTKSLSPAKCQPFPHNPHIRTTIPTQNMATRAKTLYLRPEL